VSVQCASVTRLQSPRRQNNGEPFHLNFSSRYTGVFTSFAAVFLSVPYKFLQAMTKINKSLSVVQYSADSAINK